MCGLSRCGGITPQCNVVFNFVVRSHRRLRHPSPLKLRRAVCRGPSRRQLLIYRGRTTEPLTPASTRSIPVVIPCVPLFLTLDRPPLASSPSNSLRSGFIVVTVTSDAFYPRHEGFLNEITSASDNAGIGTPLCSRPRVCVRVQPVRDFV